MIEMMEIHSYIIYNVGHCPFRQKHIEHSFRAFVQCVSQTNFNCNLLAKFVEGTLGKVKSPSVPVKWLYLIVNSVSTVTLYWRSKFQVCICSLFYSCNSGPFCKNKNLGKRKLTLTVCCNFLFFIIYLFKIKSRDIRNLDD